MTRLGIFLLGMLVLPGVWADFTVDYRLARTSVERNADDVYRLEAIGWPSSFLIDGENEETVNTSSGHLDVYFGRVDTNNVPLSEAGFLSKLSKFHLDAFVTESEYESSAVLSENGIELDRYSESLDATEVILDTDLEFVTGGFPFVFGFGTSFGFGEQEVAEFDQIYDEETEELAWRAKVGLYFSDMGRVTYSYEKRDFENTDSGREVEASTQRVSVKQVFAFPGSQFLSAQGSYGKASADTGSGDAKELGLQLVYYPIHRLGIGLGGTKSKDRGARIEDISGTNYFVEYFFNEHVGLHLRYSESDGSDSLQGDQTALLTETARFSRDSSAVSLELNARF